MMHIVKRFSVQRVRIGYNKDHRLPDCTHKSWPGDLDEMNKKY